VSFYPLNSWILMTIAAILFGIRAVVTSRTLSKTASTQFPGGTQAAPTTVTVY
jgi:hypothetical protein